MVYFLQLSRDRHSDSHWKSGITSLPVALKIKNHVPPLSPSHTKPAKRAGRAGPVKAGERAEAARGPQLHRHYPAVFWFWKQHSRSSRSRPVFRAVFSSRVLNGCRAHGDADVYSAAIDSAGRSWPAREPLAIEPRRRRGRAWRCAGVITALGELQNPQKC